MYLPHSISVRRLCFCLCLLALESNGALLLAADTQDPKEAVYSSGGDVRPPKLVHYVEPAFSSSSRDAFVDGVVQLSAVVAADGRPGNIKILKGLSDDENEQALKAVAQWRFRPGTKADKPVNVRITVEVEFHLL